MSFCPSKEREGVKNLFKKLWKYLAVSCLALAVVAQTAFAQAVADPDAVEAVTDSTGTLTATIKAAIPLILIVTIAMVVLGLAKRLVRKAG